MQVSQEERAGKGAKLSRLVTLRGLLVDLSPFKPGIIVSSSLDSREYQRLVTVVRLFLAMGEGVVISCWAVRAESSLLQSEIESLQCRWRAILIAAESSSSPTCLDAGIDPLVELFSHAVKGPLPPKKMSTFSKVSVSSKVFLLCDDVTLLARAGALTCSLEGVISTQIHLEAGLVPGLLFYQQGIEADIEAALACEVSLAGGGVCALKLLPLLPLLMSIVPQQGLIWLTLLINLLLSRLLNRYAYVT